jgi:hypothetical protein
LEHPTHVADAPAPQSVVEQSAAKAPESVPTQVAQAMGIPARPATQDISAATAFLVLLGSPLIGLAYFLLFPIVGTVIALTVLGKEIVKLFRLK